MTGGWSGEARLWTMKGRLAARQKTIVTITQHRHSLFLLLKIDKFSEGGNLHLTLSPGWLEQHGELGHVGRGVGRER